LRVFPRGGGEPWEKSRGFVRILRVEPS